ncbi:MAG TPA: UDP-3-O-(3-hydroxymyristoyl)glucosamine N-acyltransferase [Pyrinomonadaceae bacterium]|jgi:UDP-3-O-[3-hydroxymyristoyl] glucosamine N-acyltransferase|nr:UDP-3-O-(3-hydroxymyristoyl)glucosamine N-acyltransferase [Pyrinomonadaceae bacterium]
MRLAELTERTGARLEQGDGEMLIDGAAGLDEATPGEVTFLSNPRYTPRVQTTRASAIYVGENVEVGRTEIAVLRARDPYLAYTRALRLFHPEPEFEPFIHPAAAIDETAQVAPNVWIGAGASIGREVQLGNNVRIYPNATIYERVQIGAGCVIHSGVAIREGTRLGQRVVIHNNAVVGSDGFGYAKDEEGRWLKIPQAGIVVVEDDVEIGAGTTIDRASVGETRIRRGAKIDNLVQVGHSCTVGEDTLLCAQVGLAGSSHIGRRVILAGQAGVAGHLHIGDDAVLTAKSATSHDVPAGKVISGIPAFDNREWLRSTAAFRRLGEMQRTLRTLEARLKALEESSSTPQGK